MYTHTGCQEAFQHNSNNLRLDLFGTFVRTKAFRTQPFVGIYRTQQIPMHTSGIHVRRAGVNGRFFSSDGQTHPTNQRLLSCRQRRQFFWREDDLKVHVALRQRCGVNSPSVWVLSVVKTYLFGREECYSTHIERNTLCPFVPVFPGIDLLRLAQGSRGRVRIGGLNARNGTIERRDGVAL